ncbi:helix-turn-helix transcriptional regulator [Arthrobacter antioxidans]|uniref:helix-turn-helix transcriptional regulator n=1 Tax=Arthrobacter antioxidans TaxID=2895818 RepID=UPI001FFF9F90|nr:LuxR C-terminal-related transcriptional regulator [Arthrobacter antioxidans]
MEEFDQLVADGRAAYERGEWQTAYQQLEQARLQAGLPSEDLGLLGGAAWWTGRVKQSLEIVEHVYHRLYDAGDALGAARKALDVGLVWFIRGDLVIASGWANRARRILQDLPEGVEHGYLLYLDAALTLDVRDLGPAREAAARLDELGRRLRAPALTSFSLVLAGLADLRSGRTAAGFSQLDEAMLPVLAGGLPPEWAGEIYCIVIHACYDVNDLHRMRAWTRATEQWCEQFSGDVVYSGICRIHRLQLSSIEGDWAAAEDAIERSGAELVDRNNWVAGEAFYQLGELRRLRGDTAGARAAYGRARRLGADPQPGESLLQHAAGDKDAAWSGVSAALAGRDPLACARLLQAAVDIALAMRLEDEADRLCSQLEETAAVFDTPGLRAWAGHARATVLIARSRYAEAMPVLQAAAREYRGMQARYEIARVHELLARAHRGAGQAAAAAADSATALAIYRQLGALPDILRLDGGRLPGGLTQREAEVLALVAAGASNKSAAEALFISQKTVGRHLANIFAKIGTSSRTAAAAWARDHGVLPR